MLRHKIVELVYVERLAAAIYEGRYPVFFRLALIVVMLVVMMLVVVFVVMLMMVLVVVVLIIVVIVIVLDWALDPFDPAS